MRQSRSIAALVLLVFTSTPLSAEPISASRAYALPQPEPDVVVRYGDAPRQFGELRLPKARLIHHPSCSGAARPASAAFRSVAHPQRTGEYACGALGRETPQPLGLTTPRDGRVVNKAGEAQGPFPVAVIIHGGCWLSDYDHTYMAAFAKAITGLGLATWTIGYRRAGEPGGGWPNTFIDAGAAVDFLPELASRYPLDVERVLAIGHSAGGHLALWLAGRAQLPEASPLHTRDPQPIAGVLALAAAADLEYLSEQQTCGDAATRLMGGTPTERPQRYAEASPMQLLPLGVPQVLINGELDETWSAPADRYFEAASAAGDPIVRRTMPGAGHFEPVVPDSPNWHVVRAAVAGLVAP